VVERMARIKMLKRILYKFKMWRKETIDGNDYLLPGCPNDFQGLVYMTKKIINYNVIVLWRQQVI
jgi:hypothetical protein